ncbi:hypothetical protein ESCO_001325 [Escovopsis weberi]|uniref:Uncharacterized protein n=1 Tax=Escovopsis weberi TaxID=150374 RepID=A0A0M8N3C8_ESCWE|nr:hypothetical protein ESCO_001325 [Escovopsis weberi]
MPQMLGAPRAVQPHVEISDVRDECLTESDARKKLSRYIIVRMEKSSDQSAHANGTEQDSWGRAVWFIYTSANQQETRHRVRQLNKASSKTVADKKSELKTVLRCQLDKVRDFLQQGDKDCRYEHTLAQLEFEFKGGGGGGGANASGGGSPERSARSRSRSRRSSSARSKSAGRTAGCSSILAYFKRAPKADENCLSIWGEQKHASLNVFPYQTQHRVVGGPQPVPFQPGVRASRHAVLDPNAYVPQFQRLPPLATALHPAVIPAPAHTQTTGVPLMVGNPGGGGQQPAGAKSRADLSARDRASYGSTLSDSSASSHDTAETLTSESSDDSEIRRSRSVKRKEEPRGIHRRVKMAGAEGPRDKSRGRAEPGSAFDARDVLHALADCIRVEWIKGASKEEQQQQQQQASNPASHGGRSSGQSSGGGGHAFDRAADVLGGLGPGGALPQAEDGFYQFPRWTHHGQAQASVDSGSRGQPQFVVRGYLEDQQERQP